MCDTEPLWEGECEARLPEESHKELDEVHDAVVLGEGDLLRGRGEEEEWLILQETCD